jgi:hypothetical protein
MARLKMARTFLYQCPNTGQIVQGWSAEEVGDQDDDTYQSIDCLACTRVHLINLKTGKVLGERENRETDLCSFLKRDREIGRQ